jgi:negative regulator of sigma E activity
MRNVQVLDQDGKVLETYPITTTRIDGREITDQEHFDMARLAAIEDKLIAEDKADQLRFRFI